MGPRISVVVPALRASSELKATLTSCVGQDYEDLQVVIVGPQGVCSSGLLEDPRILATVQEPMGIYAAMNEGIQVSSGEWVCFLGEGDVLATGYSLSRLIACSEKGAGLIYGDVIITYRTRPSRIMRGAVNPSLKASWCMPFGHAGAIYRRELFEQVGLFDQSFVSAADYDWICRALDMGIRAHKTSELVAICAAGGVSSSTRTRKLALSEERRVVSKGLRRGPLAFRALRFLKTALNSALMSLLRG